MKRYHNGDDEGSESDLIIQNDLFSPSTKSQTRVQADFGGNRSSAV